MSRLHANIVGSKITFTGYNAKIDGPKRGRSGNIKESSGWRDARIIDSEGYTRKFDKASLILFVREQQKIKAAQGGFKPKVKVRSGIIFGSSANTVQDAFYELFPVRQDDKVVSLSRSPKMKVSLDEIDEMEKAALNEILPAGMKFNQLPVYEGKFTEIDKVRMAPDPAVKGVQGRHICIAIQLNNRTENDKEGENSVLMLTRSKKGDKWTWWIQQDGMPLYNSEELTISDGKLIGNTQGWGMLKSLLKGEVIKPSKEEHFSLA